MPDPVREETVGVDGFRCFWTSPSGADECVGELWETRKDAEAIAAVLERGGASNVHVRPSRGKPLIPIFCASASSPKDERGAGSLRSSARGAHLLRLSLDADRVVSELICVGRCLPPDPDDGPSNEPCWLRTWADNEDLTSHIEDLHELGVWRISAIFDGCPTVTLHEQQPAAPPAAGATLTTEGCEMTTTSVAPFVFIAATRYAINRLWTGASQDMAGQVLAHADLIREDAGCAGAIVRAVEEWTACGDNRGQPGVMPHEIAAAERKWLQVVEALTRIVTP